MGGARNARDPHLSGKSSEHSSAVTDTSNDTCCRQACQANGASLRSWSRLLELFQNDPLPPFNVGCLGTGRPVARSRIKALNGGRGIKLGRHLGPLDRYTSTCVLAVDIGVLQRILTMVVG